MGIGFGRGYIRGVSILRVDLFLDLDDASTEFKVNLKAFLGVFKLEVISADWPIYYFGNQVSTNAVFIYGVLGAL